MRREMTLFGVVACVAALGYALRGPQPTVPAASSLPTDPAPTAATATRPHSRTPAIAGGPGTGPGIGPAPPPGLSAGPGTTPATPATTPTASGPVGKGALAVAGHGSATLAGPPPPWVTPAEREAWIRALEVRAIKERREAHAFARARGLAPRGTVGERTYEWAAVRDGRIYVRTTHNANARISTAVDRVEGQPPFVAAGEGITVGLWDAGSARRTHAEFDWRVVVRDSAPHHAHATHVGGTLVASGVDSRARGMAPAAFLDTYDWNSDYAEMAARGLAEPDGFDGIQISNHSYGYQAGWFGGTWYGVWGEPEASGFGLYDSTAALLDQICDAAPYFLPFKAAGNDRNDAAPTPGAIFTYFDAQGQTQTKPYEPATDPPADFWDQGGYDTIAYDANAKNIMTVGAVNDAVSNGQRSLAAAGMTSFSSWGPSDDGRVKPDLVANGLILFSSSAGSDTAYASLSGTSMATPNAAGSATLLLDIYSAATTGKLMRASMLKGLMLHTADDLGNPGPDYRFGWGLVNTFAAQQLIVAHVNWPETGRLWEDRVVAAGQTNRLTRFWDGLQPIRVTLCWTDPPGAPRDLLDDRTPVLVHDLDLRIIDPQGTVHHPFVLNPEDPSAPATRGTNRVDNVEQVLIANPAGPGPYHLEVAIAGSLTRPDQHYTLIFSGLSVAPSIEHVPLQNVMEAPNNYLVEAQVRSEFGLAPGTVNLIWTSSADGLEVTSPMQLHSNGCYRAEIPPQPSGATISYYLTASTTNGLTGTSPAGTPANQHRFAVTEAIGLFITGEPVKIPGVSPGYGFHLYPSGVTVRVSAPDMGPETNDTRYLLTGYTGTGDVPASGTQAVDHITLTRDSLLTWRWSPAFRLRQTASIPGILDVQSWWLDGSQATTVLAQAEISLQGTNHAFIGWYRSTDGTRLPDAVSRAENPAGGLWMVAPQQVEARYLNRQTDDDGDGLPDWWEFYYFGGTQTVAQVDSDGDGYSNASELHDGADPTDPDSTPQPPAIAHVPIASPQERPAPWPLAAIVTDNDSVASVNLQWQVNGGGWQTQAMLPAAEGGGLYTHAIPEPALTGDTVTYRILARDRAGFLAINGIYVIPVRYPVAQVSPTDFGLTYLPGDALGFKALSLVNTGHAALHWTLSALGSGFMDSAEAGTNGWSQGGANSVWHLSTARAYDGSQSWYFGNAGSGQYPDNARAWLLSPPIYLPPQAEFSFQQWLHTEAVKDAAHAWDGALVELSLDDGASFTLLEPLGGYPYVIFGHPASPWPQGTPCFAGTVGWERVAFDLSAHAGKTVRLRLHFGSDGFEVGEGWYVDALQVSPYGGAPDWITVLTASGAYQPGAMGMVGLRLNSTTLAPAEERRAVLRLQSNDPRQPLLHLPLALHNATRFIDVDWLGAGSLSPSGRVASALGRTNAFAVTAEPYHHVAALVTQAAPVPVPPGLAATNFFWVLPPDAPATNRLSARFDANRVTNGVTELWLVAHGLTNEPFLDEALADQDGDGHAAWQEYQTGTDPLEPGSVLRLTSLSPHGTNHREWVEVFTNDLGETLSVTQRQLIVEAYLLAWPSVSGRTYRVYGSTNGPGGGEVVSPQLDATPPENRFTNGLDGMPVRYYRIGVETVAE